MLCPRCQQGEIVEARVRATGTSLFICQECEATWFSLDQIGIKKFVDFGAYLEAHDLPPLWSEVDRH